MTDETTPDAVERAKLLRSALCAAASDADEIRATILAERDITASLRDQLHQATELVSVLEERLDAFEDTEPDARACAEWVIDITQDGDMRQAARRYLSGVANRTATRLHRDNASLRDQLRKVEGERDRAKQGELDAINAMAKARQKQQDAETAADLDRWLGHDIGEESQGQFQRLYLRCKELEREQSNLRRYIQVERGGSVVNTVRLMATELTSLRSLLPDVRACAEYCATIPEPPDGRPLPVLQYGRRILAALDSAECPECHLDGGHKMSCSRGGSKGGRFGVRLDSQGGEGE